MRVTHVLVLLAVGAASGAGGVAAARADGPVVGVQDGTLVFDASAGGGESGFEFERESPDGPGFHAVRELPPEQVGPGCRVRPAGELDEGDPFAFCPLAGIRSVLVKGPLTGPADRFSDTDLVLRDPSSAGPGPQPPIPLRVEAGAPNDRIFVGDAAREDVSCGPGLDEVSADPHDVVEADCETVRGDAQRLPGSPGKVGRRAVVRLGSYGVAPAALYVPVSCPATAPDDSCTARLDVVFAGPPRLGWGSVDYAIRRGHRTTVLVPVGHDRDRVRRRAPGNPSKDTPPAVRRRVRDHGRATMRLYLTSGSATSRRRTAVTRVARQRPGEHWLVGAQSP